VRSESGFLPQASHYESGRHAAEIRRLADLWNKTAIIEDGVYRFYHESFKVANLLAVANDVHATASAARFNPPSPSQISSARPAGGCV
jgi:hypothetical protein